MIKKIACKKFDGVETQSLIVMVKKKSNLEIQCENQIAQICFHR